MLVWSFYETTNHVNGKKYLGIHGSKDFKEDKYLGSGTLLREAIRKYGKDSFSRKDLVFFTTEREAREYEKKMVTEEVLKSSEYYNLVEGGGGGSVGSKPFYIGKKRYLVAEKAIEKFRAEYPEAIEGVPEEVKERHREVMTGRKALTDGKEVKLVPSQEVNSFLKKGWYFGVTEDIKKVNSESKKGFKVMHKGSKVIHVPLSEVNYRKEEGYEEGLSDELRKNQGKLLGKVLVSRGTEIAWCNPEDLERMITEGWQKGKSDELVEKMLGTGKGTTVIHRGTDCIRVDSKELQKYLNSGWKLGKRPETRQSLEKINKSNVELRKRRAKEEAETRRIIYTRSSEYLEWWERHKHEIGRIHYGVNRFLSEKRKTKKSFLKHMKSIGEYE